MMTIQRQGGKDIKIFATTIEDTALQQIKELGEYEPYAGSKIRIMPDCHAGAGCTIGTTMEIKDKITPNLVGVDIGCGMLTITLGEKDIDLRKLDSVINEFVPNGFDVHTEPQAEFDFARLRVQNVNVSRAELSIGSLGGGNHFIEVGKNKNGELFLVVHSGSRNIGSMVATHYQKLAIQNLTDNSEELRAVIDGLTQDGRQREIPEALKKIKRPVINNHLAYLTGSDFDDYMHDMKIMQEFAVLNRRTIANIILEKTNLTETSSFETIHNYIDFNRMILRKGAVSAEDGEILLIPINMRDGSIVARGKGNPDWNYSAPHGAGRLLGRTAARQQLSLAEFQEQMWGIYSTSVLAETLDEAPGAYKSMDEIIDAIGDTVEIIDIINPIYNFKAH